MKEPLLLTDNLVENVWGGDWIARLKKKPSDGKKIGESWEFSVHPDHPGSALLPTGKTVALSSLLPKATLLLKFIDACENLSIQVHPPDDYARVHEQSSGKSESWLILDVGQAQDDGYIYLGFKTKTNAEAFKKACESSDEKNVLSYLNRVRVKPGEIYHVPPGTVHAIGKGVRLFEIQQSSGLTYRTWDWNRRSRPLHLEKALAVLDFSAFKSEPVSTHRLVDSRGHYEAEIFTRKPREEIKIEPPADYCVLTVLQGEMKLKSGPTSVTAGHSVLVPGGVAVTVGSGESLRFVKSWTKEPRPSS